jgi:hypothetical protein
MNEARTTKYYQQRIKKDEELKTIKDPRTNKYAREKILHEKRTAKIFTS